MRKQDNQHTENPKDYLAIVVFIVILLLFIASFVYLIQTTKKDSFDNTFKTASKWMTDYWHQGKRLLEGRKDIWSQSKKKRDVRKHLRAGHSLYRKKIYQKALGEFDTAIELDPDNYRAYFWRGRVHIKTNRLKEATANFEKVIDLKPDYAEAYDNLGWIHLKLEEYDRSINYLSRSLELKPNDGWTHYTRGRCYYKKGNLHQALQDIQASCSLGYTNGCQAYKEYKEKISGPDSDAHGAVKN